jgi:hypothetical protein
MGYRKNTGIQLGGRPVCRPWEENPRILRHGGSAEADTNYHEFHELELIII